MGVVHGLWCLGCCWLLFAIMFPLGMMNIAAMAALTTLVFAEKSLAWGPLLARVAAAGLVAYGLLVQIAPRALPTFPYGAGTGAEAMPATVAPMGQ
jgi:predicted metal-binding membrane protein